MTAETGYGVKDRTSGDLPDQGSKNSECHESSDPGDTRGMSAIAQESGLGRESLYKAFAPGAKPRYETVQKVLHSLGVKINVSAA